MSNQVKKSFAEEGLEDVLKESAAAEEELKAVTDDDEEGEMQEVGGLEPISFYWRMSAPKKAQKQPWKILEKDQVINGVYEGFFVSGKYKNPTYRIRVTEGEHAGKLTGISAGGLNKGMSKLLETSKVRITYNGMRTIKSGEWAGNDAHNFTVLGNKLKR